MDINTLIIKIPTIAHERVTRVFTFDFNYQIANIGLLDLNNLIDIGATAYKGTSSKKEPNSCWKPLTA